MNLLKVWPKLNLRTKLCLRDGLQKTNEELMLVSAEAAIRSLMPNDREYCNAADCDTCQDVRLMRRYLREFQKRRGETEVDH